jgi:transmembrane sensor
MRDEHDLAASMTEQAAFGWMVTHGDGASTAEHREFAEWVVKSPERVAAYLRAVRVQQALKSPAIKWPDTPAETLIREAKAAPPEPVQMPLADVVVLPASRRRVAPIRLRTVFAMAAAVVLAVGIAWLMPARPQQFQTAFGEQRSVLLEDGSHITLNSSSKIEVTLRSDNRLVQLVEGEALFDVAHDPARPFYVRAGNASVRVLGTRFDVDLRRDRTTVTVVEGLVAVGAASQAHEPPTLTAGDRVVVTDAGAGLLQHGVDVSAAIAWTQQQLVFEKRPLGEVAEEFNRYNRQQITIEGDILRKEKISGVFQSHNVASFLSFLAGIPGVHVRDDGAGGYVVTSDPAQPSTI